MQTSPLDRPTTQQTSTQQTSNPVSKLFNAASGKAWGLLVTIAGFIYTPRASGQCLPRPVPDLLKTCKNYEFDHYLTEDGRDMMDHELNPIYTVLDRDTGKKYVCLSHGAKFKKGIDAAGKPTVYETSTLDFKKCYHEQQFKASMDIPVNRLGYASNERLVKHHEQDPALQQELLQILAEKDKDRELDNNERIVHIDFQSVPKEEPEEALHKQKEAIFKAVEPEFSASRRFMFEEMRDRSSSLSVPVPSAALPPAPAATITQTTIHLLPSPPMIR